MEDQFSANVDVLYDDDAPLAADVDPTEVKPAKEPETKPEGDTATAQVPDSDFVLDLLKSKNIDPDKISDGETEYKWAELSPEDKTAVLQQLLSEQLPSEEQQLLEQFRSSGKKLEEFIQPAMPTVQSGIDDYTDEDLFLADLITRYGEKAKNEEFFKKRWEVSVEDEETHKHLISNLRQQYSEVLAETKAAAARKEVEDDVAVIRNETQGIDTVFNEFPMNDEVKAELVNDLTDIDEDGYTPFMRELFSDPKKMFEAAFALKYMPDLLREIHSSYQEELNNAYQKGKSDALNDKTISFISSEKPGKEQTPTPAGVDALYD